MIIGQIKSNIKDYRRRMQAHQKQVNYATSRAINDTLKEVRPPVIKRIRLKQKSNKPWWNNRSYGVKISFSNKYSLVGDIHTDIYWNFLQEEGGTKRPHGHSKLLIPTKNTPAYAKKAGGASRVLENRKTLRNPKTKSPFVKTRSGKVGVFQRTTKKRLPIKKMYTVSKSALIDRPILGFRAIAERTVRRKFKGNLDRRLQEAFRTAK